VTRTFLELGPFPAEVPRPHQSHRSPGQARRLGSRGRRPARPRRLPINDFHWGRKWDLHNSGPIVSGAGTHLGTTGKVDADIDWLETYTRLQNQGGVSGSNVVIAILDTGIRAAHQDLNGKVIGGINYANGPAGNWGESDDHGTHVSGIAAARANNSGSFANGLGGVPGVAYPDNVELLAVRVCGTTGCATSAIANGITWARNNGAHFINLTLGGPSAQSAIQTALHNAPNVLAFCSTSSTTSCSSRGRAWFPSLSA
jgi:subtilisin family serine protease